MCSFNDKIDIKPDKYKIFANERVGYQRELKQIKDLIIE